MATCTHRKADGTECRAPALLDGSGLCAMHAPHLAEKMRRARTRGGRAAGPRRRPAERIQVALPEEAPPPPQTLEDAVRWASWATHAVTTGRIHPKVAGEVARLLKEFRAALEKRAIEGELDELRAKLETLTRPKGVA